MEGSYIKDSIFEVKDGVFVFKDGVFGVWKWSVLGGKMACFLWKKQKKIVERAKKRRPLLVVFGLSLLKSFVLF